MAPHQFQSIMKIHHYGLATGDLDRSMEAFRALGYEVGEVIEDPLQQVKLAFVSCPGHAIELVCDLEPGEGPTGKIVSASGTHLYHICFEVENIEATMAELRSKRYLVRRQPVPAVAFGGRRIAWLYNRDVGLVELLEKAG